MWESSHTLGERLATAIPALALGLAAGVLGGVFAAGALDTTPYGPTEFNTASRQAHENGRAEGLQQAAEAASRTASEVKAANAEHVAALRSKLTRTRKALRDAGEQAREQKADLAGLEASLAEKTAALDNATSQARATGEGQAVEGTLKAVWTLGRGAKPWPTGCAEPLQTYRVRVTAGADATVAVADLVDAEVVRRTEKKNLATLVCSMTYSASLPTPLGSEYRFLVEAGESGGARAQEQVSSSALADGSGPTIWVSR
jgi:hypothetical protein